MTVRQSLIFAKEKLERQVQSPWLEAVDLLAHALDRPREHILTLEPEKKIPQHIALRVKKLVQERMRGWPLPYLLGRQSFFGLDFYVNQSVMIPRPETELLVQEALKELKNVRTEEPKNIAVVDVGTGSGCIAIALAKKIQCLEVRPPTEVEPHRINFFATDISAAALAVAKKNAKLHGVFDRIAFLQGDLLEPVHQFISFSVHQFLIVANLPYLTPQDIKANPLLDFEPRLALDGGLDGLSLYRRLFTQIKKLQNLTPQASNFRLLLEIDQRQTKSITSLITSHWNNSSFEVASDFRNLPRVISVSLL